MAVDDGAGADDFVYGAGRIGVEDADGSTATFSYDPFGSALATAATDEWARSASYGPFGQQQNASWADPLAHTPAFGYRGELTLDNTIHLRARTYEPAEGRFTTRDPLDGLAGTTVFTSPYAYANNDPLSFVDSLGLSVDDCSLTETALENFTGAYSGVSAEEQAVSAYIERQTGVPSDPTAGRTCEVLDLNTSVGFWDTLSFVTDHDQGLLKLTSLVLAGAALTAIVVGTGGTAAVVLVVGAGTTGILAEAVDEKPCRAQRTAIASVLFLLGAGVGSLFGEGGLAIGEILTELGMQGVGLVEIRC
ncbi:MAG: RHS repeat-associated core domain-containing protein [Actinobacteria bacterium]|nr:MAG: RHS repeat-associated core domain-containing protein [Actinomycetota bacterium]